MELFYVFEANEGLSARIRKIRMKPVKKALSGSNSYINNIIELWKLKKNHL